jgi:hypothetical protein
MYQWLAILAKLQLFSNLDLQPSVFLSGPARMEIKSLQIGELELDY